MDPTAPKENNQNNSQGYQADQDNPIQPGQFVVSGESAAQATQSQNNPLQSPPNPQPSTGDLERNLKETVAQVAGSVTGGSMQEQSPQSVSLEQQSSVLPESTPVISQPDPTPFVQPQQESTIQPGASIGVPASGAAPAPQRPDMDSGSKTGKIIPIVVGLVVLVAIIVVVTWFFILNRKSKEPTTTLDQSQEIEVPASPSPASGRGFGEISQSPSPLVSPDLTEGSGEQTPPPVETGPPSSLTTQ